MLACSAKEFHPRAGAVKPFGVSLICTTSSGIALVIAVPARASRIDFVGVMTGGEVGVGIERE